MEILVGYVIRSRTARYLGLYWDHPLMVAWAGRYDGIPFQGLRGFTQGETLYPTIFNIMVDDVMRHWVMLVTGGESDPEGFGQVIQWITEFST